MKRFNLLLLPIQTLPSPVVLKAALLFNTTGDENTARCIVSHVVVNKGANSISGVSYSGRMDASAYFYVFRLFRPDNCTCVWRPQRPVHTANSFERSVA